LRILFVNPRVYLPQLLGGVETTTFDLCRQLTLMGHETAVMSQIGRGDAIWFFNRLKSYLTGRLFPRGDYRGMPVYRGYGHKTGLGPVIADFRPDALVVSGGADESFELVVQCRGTGLPTVFYFHELNTLRRLKTPALLEGVTFVANSAYTARAVLEVLGRGAAVVPPLVDREAYRLTSTRRHVTMVNPRRIKGGQTAFDLARACPDIAFMFVEAWHTKDEFVGGLREAARAMPSVTWRKPTLDMRSVYASTRILLAPSEWEETWGRVVTEAHAAGIPVLARAYAGLPESVGRGGILMAPDASLAEWTQALRSMWDDHALYEVLVQRTREFSERPDAQPAYLAEAFIAALRTAVPATPSTDSPREPPDGRR
jgi:glycosyltransferase involved in cell wall biosynthesis